MTEEKFRKGFKNPDVFYEHFSLGMIILPENCIEDTLYYCDYDDKLFCMRKFKDGHIAIGEVNV